MKTSPAMSDLPTVIRFLRESRHMTQPQLARRGRMSWSHLYLIENGKTTPGLATLEKISLALNVGLVRFFIPSSRELALLEDSFVQSICLIVCKLRPDQKELVLGTLQAAPQRRRRIHE
jgi:transcriptional regulator with XRE-family HTH domain